MALPVEPFVRVCETCSVPIYSPVYLGGAPSLPGPLWTRAGVDSVSEGHGELWVSMRDGRLHVDHADPSILMSHSLFYLLFMGECTDEFDYLPGPDGGHQGAIIKINGSNGTWIYRVEKFISHEDGWLLVWPD